MAKPLQQQAIDARNRKRTETAGRHAIVRATTNNELRQGGRVQEVFVPASQRERWEEKRSIHATLKSNKANPSRSS